jgi:hypothetical protein
MTLTILHIDVNSLCMKSVSGNLIYLLLEEESFDHTKKSRARSLKCIWCHDIAMCVREVHRNAGPERKCRIPGKQCRIPLFRKHREFRAYLVNMPYLGPLGQGVTVALKPVA